MTDDDVVVALFAVQLQGFIPHGAGRQHDQGCAGADAGTGETRPPTAKRLVYSHLVGVFEYQPLNC